MPYTIPPLRFSYDALEPYLDAEDVRYHHEVVHRSYTKGINALLRRYPQYDGDTIEELLRGLDRIPAEIRRQFQHYGSGHANHQFLWKVLGPPKPRDTRTALSQEIDGKFGSFTTFERLFFEKAMSLGTEGWAFLSLSEPRTGELEIIVLPENGNVLSMSKPGILIVDLWNHAHNKTTTNREVYLRNVWQVIDWDVCNRRFVLLRDGASQL